MNALRNLPTKKSLEAKPRQEIRIDADKGWRWDYKMQPNMKFFNRFLMAAMLASSFENGMYEQQIWNDFCFYFFGVYGRTELEGARLKWTQKLM